MERIIPIDCPQCPAKAGASTMPTGDDIHWIKCSCGACGYGASAALDLSKWPHGTTIEQAVQDMANKARQHDGKGFYLTADGTVDVTGQPQTAIGTRE